MKPSPRIEPTGRSAATRLAALTALVLGSAAVSCHDAGATAVPVAAPAPPSGPPPAAAAASTPPGGDAAGGSSAAHAPAAAAAGADRTAEVESLIRAFTPPAKDVTSDITDGWIRDRKAALRKHVAADPTLGQACYRAYRERAELGFDVRRDLLEVAARTDPTAMRDELAEEFERYGGELGLRSRAIELLGELDPPRALAVLEPLVVEARKQKTYPPQETLLRAWNDAALRAGIDRTPLLTRVAADLLQDDPARHLAVRQLGTCEGLPAAQALEAVLVESTGNGYLRRLAAQSLAGNKKFTTACATLQRVLERESDDGFAQFLDDLVAKSCH